MRKKTSPVLTSGQIASICNVSTRTVTKWIDSGILKGYRIPLSKDRRVNVLDLREFVSKNAMPVEIPDEFDDSKDFDSTIVRLKAALTKAMTVIYAAEKMAGNGKVKVVLSDNSYRFDYQSREDFMALYYMNISSLEKAVST